MGSRGTVSLPSPEYKLSVIYKEAASEDVDTATITQRLSSASPRVRLWASTLCDTAVFVSTSQMAVAV